MNISVSELIVRYLGRLGIDTIFGMPGAHVLPIYDRLHDSGIRSVLVKHEQGAAFMAGGYARVAHRPSACIATAGPGATNLITGIANAYAERLPVLAITGETSTYIFGRGGLQESSGEGGAIDQGALFASITRYHKLIERTDYLGQVLNQATQALRRALDEVGLPYEMDEGGGAFYGPKIDIKVRDALGREWQTSTIQFDFNLPERFEMTYVGEDQLEHQPYMVHRALLGSLERFFGALIEHYGGAFPVWLAPGQTEVIPIAERHTAYALQVAEQLKAAGLRAEVDQSGDRMQAKIRAAQLEKIPYMLVVGDREAEGGKVAVRLRSGQDLGAQPVADFVAMALAAVAERRDL